MLLGCGKGASEEILISRLTLSETQLTLREGDVHALSVIIAPSNASDRRLEWASSQPDVVMVGAEGLLIAVKVGKSVISATSADARKKATCEVTVVPAYVPVESVRILDDSGSSELSGTEVELYMGDVIAVAAGFQPEDATNKNVSWTSSDPMVVSVKDGLVKALSLGTATLTVTADAGGVSASCTVHVTTYVPPTPVTGVSLSPALLSLRVGGSYQLKAEVLPGDATNRALTWYSSAPEVAEVDANGKVTALSAGKAAVTVRTKDGGYTASSNIIVMNADGKDGTGNESLYEVDIPMND